MSGPQSETGQQAGTAVQEQVSFSVWNECSSQFFIVAQKGSDSLTGCSGQTMELIPRCDSLGEQADGEFGVGWTSSRHIRGWEPA